MDVGPRTVYFSNQSSAFIKFFKSRTFELVKFKISLNSVDFKFESEIKVFLVHISIVCVCVCVCVCARAPSVIF